eukprot:GHVN01051600.1.p1 GENE.GHVN01051600.1~~GHVN01051600.1.p1  ORF type:complete len:115 (+),score=10.64 GHVN01051600.1:404-748(+)
MFRCFNHWSGTLLLVWHTQTPRRGLKTSIHLLQDICQGIREPAPTGMALQSLSIPPPGFIEFGEMNARIVTSSTYSSNFTFWCMENFVKVFEVSNVEYKEIRISRGTVVFFKYF